MTTLANVDPETMMPRLEKLIDKKKDNPRIPYVLISYLLADVYSKTIQWCIDTKLNFRAEYHFKHLSIIFKF